MEITQIQDTPAGPKDFFLNLGMFVALYVSAIGLINLLFNVINTAFPDSLSFVDPYSRTIRWTIAMLVIFFPVYLYLTRSANREIALNPGKKNVWVRRWLAYLTLFVAGLTVAIDLVTLINSFLGGEITLRFILKVAAVLIVAAGIFGYYFADLRKTEPRPGCRKLFGWASGIFVLAALVLGFVVMGSPATARQIRFDNERVSDLQNIQWQVVDYWQRTGSLPTSTGVLADGISGFSVPADPETKKAYVYEATGNNTFKLCATFGRAAQSNQSEYRAPLSVSDNWQHAAGTVCYDRTIDPARYPVTKQKSAVNAPMIPAKPTPIK